ncbi:hypothetical protein EJ04DRAFT_5850 [Polyplosphaeria fusca]|uniref:Uncharacterized protein n=1 Tax=Polyplosphaeria fusca TaxID=682080 RepID=A0A9P4VAD3_9PLEO|nr:hypothetical protein EJ04DRAFT_5850 [Polyplosphaeria fusca]
MDFPSRRFSSRDLPPNRTNTQDALTTSLDGAQNSSPRATTSLTPSPDALLPSASPGPSASTDTQVKSSKIEKTEHLPIDEAQTKNDFKYTVCAECRQIHFDKIISLGGVRDIFSDGVYIQNMGKRLRQRIRSDCLLCQMLVDSRVFDYENAEIKMMQAPSMTRSDRWTWSMRTRK